MPTLFHHVSVPRPPGPESATTARLFYIDLIGLREIPVPESLQALDLVWFGVGDGELHLYAETQSAGLGRHFCLHVDDQAALRAKLTAAGVTCTDTIAIPGRPRFFCTDPFGNSIEITTIQSSN
ncbi:MAG: VOC family protein [Roseiflexaceae bacterium]